ncbi:porin family protein [Sunxiuqinia indica]|uniref:hypothetical protein n=1 Tax=Sunxiuqinia indica TaxID=2692584 RepID=UPI001357C1BE|nr:hypothetical protein [Sunxiuqinia indica]
MKSRDQKNIDELFRTGLNPDFDPVVYEESNWTELEKRLIWFERRQKAIIWLRPLAGIAALLLIAFSIWTLWPTSLESFNQPLVTEQQKESAPAEIEKENTTSKLATEDPNSSLRSEKLIASTQTTKETKNSKQEETITPVQESEKAIDAPAQVISETPSDSNETPEVVSPEENPPSFTQTDTVRYEEMTEPTDEPLLATHELESAKKASTFRSVALSLLVAPAYNSVNSLSEGSVGGDFGLLISLGLSEKWSISTGAVYAKKVYATDLNTYSNYGSGSNSETVDADCRVLDIPLNINYAILNRGKTTVSLGTGVSSYLMLREEYYFANTNPYGSNQDDVHLVNENQHWLSVLNFQANIQQQLSSKISISLQPYLKLPFQDIGYAKVRLQSVGMALSANWNI